MSKRKIFLIEDNRTEGMLLKLALSSLENVDINSFSRGQELIDCLHQNPEIAIVDIMLPDISGYELIKIILEHNPKTRIVQLKKISIWLPKFKHLGFITTWLKVKAVFCIYKK